MLQAVASSIALMREEMKEGFKEVNERLDMQGASLAYKEYSKLEKRVKKLEIKIVGT